MTHVDVAIIGAGAAGVGAARTLAASGQSILLIEASDRVGGRAHTVTLDGHPHDMGCGWLHSAERNPWVAVAEAAGHAIDRSPNSWGEQYRDLGFAPADQAAAGQAYDAFEQRLRSAPFASDRAADALEPGGVWNGFIDALSGYINGANLSALSVRDYLAYDDAASEVNWRLPGGYGTLVAGSLPPVPLVLACPVTALDLSGGTVRLDTPRGTIEAARVIVTVSTTVLASDAIRWPAALDQHRHAAAMLPLGLADKLFLALDEPDDIAADKHLLGNPRSANTGSYYLRPFGRPVIECFYGGCSAEALEREGLNGAAAFAIDELVALLGSAMRPRLRLIAGSAWARTTYVGGSYSHALPGQHDARDMLARPLDDRLFFAGEACSTADFSTAHGALATGIAAAEAALASF
ncbi:monoamine oxidase [Sphingomonas guangdongensis]|uniref:Tryptophan 2-monooxygenase n=1 Tax=Sphingomonas guangdongensis TaxID=1141890 RepID=A0A285R5V2_9SPHN|nr:NAD(P)/FAD-dependent oxidoreductase [Sphingomonas guangdongensis]SOB87717.1 monoamine oxidase [Sphingomonas guangdongensis]